MLVWLWIRVTLSPLNDNYCLENEMKNKNVNKFYTRGSTKRRIKNGSKMVEYERLAKERGVPVSRVIAEAIS